MELSYLLSRPILNITHKLLHSAGYLILDLLRLGARLLYGLNIGTGSTLLACRGRALGSGGRSGSRLWLAHASRGNFIGARLTGVGLCSAGRRGAFLRRDGILDFLEDAGLRVAFFAQLVV